MGAIGKAIKNSAYFEIFDKTNKENFRKFLYNLIRNLKPIRRGERPYFITDNAGSHRNKENYELMAAHFNVIYQPSYSCKFNSIETLWALVKKRWLKSHTKVLIKKESTRDNSIALLKIILDEIGEEQIVRLLNANDSYIEE